MQPHILLDLQNVTPHTLLLVSFLEVLTFLRFWFNIFTEQRKCSSYKFIPNEKLTFYYTNMCFTRILTIFSDILDYASNTIHTNNTIWLPTSQIDTKQTIQYQQMKFQQVGQHFHLSAKARSAVTSTWTPLSLFCQWEKLRLIKIFGDITRNCHNINN